MAVDRTLRMLRVAIHNHRHVLRAVAFQLAAVYLLMLLNDATSLTAVHFGWFLDLDWLFVSALVAATITLWSSIASAGLSERGRTALDVAFIVFLALTVVLLFEPHAGGPSTRPAVDVLYDARFHVHSFTVALAVLVVESHRDPIGELLYEPTARPDGDGPAVTWSVPSRFRSADVSVDPHWVAAVGIVLAFLLLGLNHLGQFLSVDDPKWLYTRVPQLYDALGSMEWARTYINDKPGLIPALLAGLVNFVYNLESFGPLTLDRYLFWWRAPIVMFNAAMLLVAYRFLRELVDDGVALLVLGFVGLNPLVVGLSQLVNPDATLWSLSFLSMLTFLLYLRSNETRNAVYSGGFLGLALLSKYFATVLFVVYPVVAYVEFLLGPTTEGEFFDRIGHVLLLVGVATAVYGLLFPAAWFDLDTLIRGTVGAPVLQSGRPWFLLLAGFMVFELTILNGFLSRRVRTFCGGQRLAPPADVERAYDGGWDRPFDPEAFARHLVVTLAFGIALLLVANAVARFPLIDPGEFIWEVYVPRQVGTVPTLLTSMYVTLYVVPLPVLVAIGATYYYFSAGRLDDFQRLTVYATTALVAVFVLGSAVGGYVAIPRYQSILYPAFGLLGAMSVERATRYRPHLVVAGIVLMAVVSLGAAPFYLHHTNALNTNDVVVGDPWGYGGYELAQQMNRLNRQTDSDIVVWSDREGFNAFYAGPSYWRGSTGPYDTESEVDYLILSRGGERIFHHARRDWERGDRYLYARVAGTTNLLEHYEREGRYEVCLGQENNCVRAVPFNGSG